MSHPQPVTAGRRVELRRPCPRDLEEVLALIRASRRFHRPWVYPPCDARSLRLYLEAICSERSLGLLVCRRSNGAITGLIHLSEIVRGALQGAYLGYWVGAPHAGCGYMSEGLTLAIDHAFQDLRLHRLEANIQPGNERSIALAQRLGFRKEGFSPRYLKIGGRWRDHERWALLKEDWRVRRRPRSLPPEPRSARGRRRG